MSKSVTPLESSTSACRPGLSPKYGLSLRDLPSQVSARALTLVFSVVLVALKKKFERRYLA